MNIILKKFYNQLKIAPETIILIDEMNSFSFKDVNNYSDYIAKNIILYQSHKSFVPFYITEDIYLLPTVLAILKNGKIPIPLNIALPFEEAIQQITDIEYDIIITNNEIHLKNILYLDEFHTDEVIFENSHYYNNISYCVMTSGTTGIPKKILLTDKNIDGILSSYYKTLSLSSSSIILAITPATFDVSLSEILAPIFIGCKLICFGKIINDSSKKIKNTLKYIKKYKVTYSFFSPSYLKVIASMAKYNELDSLKSIAVGGENFPLSLMHLLKNKINSVTNVFNVYGPAETTLFATYYQVKFNEEKFIPIGKPFDNVEVSSIKNNQDIELLIGGVGVSLGYTNKSLNLTSFCKINDKSFYKTGDYVFYDDDNNLVFKGRKDNQVKINGVRIEIESVDNILEKNKFIKICKTIYVKGKLYCFVVLEKSAENKNNVEMYIKENIPKNYGLIVKYINNMPLTFNRKIDSAKLKRLVINNKDNNFIIDEMFTKIKKILDTEYGVIDINELDSLELVSFYLKIEEEYDVFIDDSLFYDLTNINNLIKYIQTNQKDIVSTSISEDDTKYDLYNLNNLWLKNNEFNGELHHTLYIHKNYYDKNYHSVLYFDIYLNKYRQNKLNDLVKFIADNYDIFKLMIYKKNDNIYFKYVESYIPYIYWTKKLITEDEITKLMFSNFDIPLFLINIDYKKNICRFYFSHHIIDKYTLYSLANTFVSFLDGKDVKSNTSSYLDYIKWVREESYKFEQIDKWLPNTENSITYDDKPHYLKLDINNITFHSNIDISILSIYILSKIYFSEHTSVNILTGSIVDNTRDYANSTFKNTVGDLHITFPYYIIKNDSLSSFSERVYNTLELYKQGISIREKIFEDYPNYNDKNKKFKEMWEAMNFSVNFIGEIKDVSNYLSKITTENYSKKYLIICKYKDYLYLYMPKKFLYSNYYLIDDVYHIFSEDIN